MLKWVPWACTASHLCTKHTTHSMEKKHLWKLCLTTQMSGECTLDQGEDDDDDVMGKLLNVFVH